jgi:hypothetical protein
MLATGEQAYRPNIYCSLLVFFLFGSFLFRKIGC